MALLLLWFGTGWLLDNMSVFSQILITFLMRGIPLLLTAFVTDVESWFASIIIIAVLVGNYL